MCGHQPAVAAVGRLDRHQLAHLQLGHRPAPERERLARLEVRLGDRDPAPTGD